MISMPWYIESPFFEDILQAANLDAETAKLVRHYAYNGYVIIDSGIEDVDATAERIIRALAPKYPQGSRRMQDAWYLQEDVQKIASSKRVMNILKILYGREPIPFQTLNFDVGTQQRAHSDTLHFHSVPRHYMCGVWVALEDIDSDNGPLFYYPGSHKLPDFNMNDIGLPSSYDYYPKYEDFIEALALSHGFEKKELYIKKGQALIWSANLLHGGSPIRDKKRTRHSQVTHYYFSDCMYYIPMGTDPFIGKTWMREVINIATGKLVPHYYNGVEVQLSKFDKVWRYPRPLPASVRTRDSEMKTTPVKTTLVDLGNYLDREYLLEGWYGDENEGEETYNFLDNLESANIFTNKTDYVAKTEFTINDDKRGILYEHPDSKVIFKDVHINENAELKFGIGIDEKAWDKAGDGVLFEIIIIDEKSENNVIFSRYIDPKNNVEDRKWFDNHLDLKAFTGQKVSFIFKTDSGPKGDGAYDWAGWSSPEIISRVYSESKK